MPASADTVMVRPELVSSPAPASMPIIADPITASLNASFKKSSWSTSSSLDHDLSNATRKALLPTVEFDSPVTFSGSLDTVSPGVKNTLIILNPLGGLKNESKGGKVDFNAPKSDATSTSEKAVPKPPQPKIVFHPMSLVTVGYSQHRVPGSGMMNLGNTCYLNSTLQALFHTPALFNYLMSGSHAKQCRNNVNSLNRLVLNTIITSNCMLCSVTATLKESLSSHSTRPGRIYEKLKAICKHMVHGRQEDAHEFLRYLIEALQRSYLFSAHASPKTLDAPSRDTTPFNQIFGGVMQQDIQCLKCKYVSTTFQQFMDLLLDIRNASTIEEALETSFGVERLGSDGHDMYKCEHCNTKVPAKKSSFLQRPPVVLCLQLKRFSLLGGKISKIVQLARRLDLTKFSMEMQNPDSEEPTVPLTYRLVSMITHEGPSPNCGHYTAIGEAQNGQFFQFNDGQVRPIHIQHVLTTASYVVLYEMTKATKQAWIDGKSCYQKASPAAKPCTITSATPVSKNGALPSSSHSAKPRLISANGKVMGPEAKASKPVVPAPVSAPAKTNGMTRLVPYDEDSNGSDAGSTSPAEDRKAPTLSLSNGAASKAPPASLPALKSPFVPRSVTVNSLKKQPLLSPRPQSPAVVLANPWRNDSPLPACTATTPSSSGTWKVIDSDHHASSVMSDNGSTGSASSNGWKVTDACSATPIIQETSKDFKEAVSSLLSECSSRPASGGVKRRSSSDSRDGSSDGSPRQNGDDDYDADLDRGRTKKVKLHHSEPRKAFNSNSGNNPFQKQQNFRQNRDSWNGAGGGSSWAGNSHRNSSPHQSYNRFHSNGGYSRGYRAGGGGGGGGFQNKSFGGTQQRHLGNGYVRRYSSENKNDFKSRNYNRYFHKGGKH